MENFMQEAIDEAVCSLREGNHGFGSVIIKNNQVIAKAHDLEETSHDPTSHAEINAVRSASGILGKNLSGCILISTHEPCPMCSAAIFWAGIDKVGYGCSIEESITQGRERINLSCMEIFHRSGKKVTVYKDILKDQCRILYRQDVRDEIKRLRNTTDEKLTQYNDDSINRRLQWFKNNSSTFSFINNDLLESAYNLLLCRFNIESSEAPVIYKNENRILFHSKNFCPTLEACRILDLDTKYICKKYNENSTDTLIKQIDSRLRFSRNYDKLRPYSDYCEEMIYLEKE
jgi:tRNA(adenine34) deaminase